MHFPSTRRDISEPNFLHPGSLFSRLPEHEARLFGWARRRLPLLHKLRHRALELQREPCRHALLEARPEQRAEHVLGRLVVGAVLAQRLRLLLVRAALSLGPASRACHG